MAQIGRIIFYGKTYVPSGWFFKQRPGINRLYYIHGGSGGYTVDGEKYPFRKDTFYFLPHSADFGLFSDDNDPILHTYIDFELLPPYATNKILSMKTEDDKFLNTAKDAFLLGAEYIISHGRRLKSLKDAGELYDLSLGGIKYLCEQINIKNGIEPIKDKMVLFSLEYMTKHLSEKITVEDIAGLLYVTPNCLTRKFNKQIGITPYAYLKNLRIAVAESMISNGKTLKEAAALTGYSDSVALHHAMKKRNT